MYGGYPSCNQVSQQLRTLPSSQCSGWDLGFINLFGWMAGQKVTFVTELFSKVNYSNFIEMVKTGIIVNYVHC